jgi:hypothetical protein
MACTDYGDFGRTEPTAVLDTIGVSRAHAGVAVVDVVGYFAPGSP